MKSLSKRITNCLSVIQHAWHFWYAVVSVLKCHADAWSLRASHLSKALCSFINIGVYIQLS